MADDGNGNFIRNVFNKMLLLFSAQFVFERAKLLNRLRNFSRKKIADSKICAKAPDGGNTFNLIKESFSILRHLNKKSIWHLITNVRVLY